MASFENFTVYVSRENVKVFEKFKTHAIRKWGSVPKGVMALIRKEMNDGRRTKHDDRG
jgi:hypothetical protein